LLCSQEPPPPPPLVAILSQMLPVHAFPPYFLKILSNIILTWTPRSYEWPLLFRFSDQNIVCISYFRFTRIIRSSPTMSRCHYVQGSLIWKTFVKWNFSVLYCESCALAVYDFCSLYGKSGFRNLVLR